ncbi:hypothetical protein BKA80DRAFT_299254 [Phyllosticta citrichinensis]
MEQLYQSLDDFQSRWIRLRVVPVVSQPEVKDQILETTTPVHGQHGKVAGDDAELTLALKQYKDMVQHRQTLAMEEYNRLVQRIGELTSEDEVLEIETECIVMENQVDYDDPYGADDEDFCEDKSAPSTRPSTPSFTWTDDDGKSSATMDTSPNHVHSPNNSPPTCFLGLQSSCWTDLRPYRRVDDRSTPSSTTRSPMQDPREWRRS